MEQEPALLEQIKQAELDFEAARTRLLDLRRQAEPGDVTDYSFKDTKGDLIPISSLFGDKDELLLIHNMGAGCSYCTLWADGLNGTLPYLSDRASIALLSNDSPAKMKSFAESRGWKFNLVSAEGSTFAKDFGVASEEYIHPGVSALKRDPDGRVFRTCWADFGPGDLYCPTWHLFDLLPNGINDWEPNYNR